MFNNYKCNYYILNSLGKPDSSEFKKSILLSTVQRLILVKIFWFQWYSQKL